MSASNGYDVTRVLDALNRLGWINPSESGYGIVDASNQLSASGRYFNDNSFHSSLTIQNIKEAQPDPEISDANFNAFLVQLRKANIMDILNQVFNKPELIEKGFAHYKSNQSTPAVRANGGKFVGRRIEIAPGDYGLHLSNAQILLNGDKTFKLYLFNEFSGKLQEWDVNAIADQQTNVVLNYDIFYSSATLKGGSFFLGYFQDDLGTVQAYDYSACYNPYHTVGISSIESAVTGDVKFNMSQYSTGTDIHGMNVEFEVFRDKTNTIVSSARLFDNIQGLMMAARVIELIINSTRMNIRKMISQENLNGLYKELNLITTGETPFSPGLKRKIEKAIAVLQETFEPKNKAQAVSISS